MDSCTSLVPVPPSAVLSRTWLSVCSAVPSAFIERWMVPGSVMCNTVFISCSVAPLAPAEVIASASAMLAGENTTLAVGSAATSRSYRSAENALMAAEPASASSGVVATSGAEPLRLLCPASSAGTVGAVGVVEGSSAASSPQDCSSWATAGRARRERNVRRCMLI